MERRATGRVLHFAVTGALLSGGLAVGGCKTVPEVQGTNTGPMMAPEGGEGGEAPEHVNEEPVEEPAADEPESPDADVNPGPQPEPKTVNTEEVSEP